MWNPEYIKFRNLMSHKETEYNFKRGKSVLIYGINENDEGLDSNGSGKSTILEAINIAVTGDANRDISKDEVVNDYADECYIELKLNNKICEIKDLTIKRWIYRKKSSKIEIWENGKLNEQLTSVIESNKRIYELLGLTREDLLYFFIIGQETNNSFLSETDTNKKKIISRFNDTGFIQEKVEEIKKESKLIKEELSDLELKLSKSSGSIETIKESISKEKEEEKKGVFIKIKPFQEKIKSLKQKIKELELSISSKPKMLKKLELKLKNKKFNVLKNEKILNKNRRLKVKEKSKLEKERNEAQSTLERLKLLQGEKIECPKCTHKFLIDSEIKLEEIPQMLEEIESLILTLNEDINKTKNYIKKIDKKLESIEEIEEEKLELESEKSEIESKLKNLKNSIKNKESLIIQNEKEIEEIKENFSKSKKIKELEISLDKKRNSYIDLELRIEKVKDDLDKKDFWIMHFGKKGFQTFLTNKSIKSIEGLTNSYLEKMNIDLRVKIDGFSILKSGDLREKIEVNILRNGIILGSYNRYSGGERGRIKLANILAMRKLFNLTAPNGGLNFLGLDEVFEGLDVTGQKQCMKILEGMNITNLVISHRNESIGAENELIVEKIENFSYLK